MNNISFDHILLSCDSSKNEYMCNIFVNDEKVGYCKYDVVHSDIIFCYIEYINIDPQHRRKGYATEIVHELKKKYDLRWNLRFTPEGRQWYYHLINNKII